MNETKNKISDDLLKGKLGFDLYGRYAIIRNIIDQNRKDGEKFRVLDVGGRGNMLSMFLPSDDVFYMDPFVESEDKNFIKGDGCAIPLGDQSFDWVTSADVFEHIPKENREDFLRENIRVAKDGVILAAPFFSKEVARAEVNANESYKILSGGQDYIWLKEHIENGLPEEKLVEEFISEAGYEFQKLHNNRLFLWELLIGLVLNVTEINYKALKDDYEKFNLFYNTDVFPFDSEEMSYRKIYFIKKQSGLKDIEIEKKVIDDILFLDVIKKAMDMFAKLDVMNKGIILEKNQEIQLVKQEILEKNQECQLVKQEIMDKDQELEKMKESKFWKLRNCYLTLKAKCKIK